MNVKFLYLRKVVTVTKVMKTDTIETSSIIVKNNFVDIPPIEMGGWYPLGNDHCSRNRQAGSAKHGRNVVDLSKVNLGSCNLIVLRADVAVSSALPPISVS